MRHLPWVWGSVWRPAAPLPQPRGTAAPILSHPHVSHLGPAGPALPVPPHSVSGCQGPSGSGGPEEGTAGFLHPYTRGPYGVSQELWEGCGREQERKRREPPAVLPPGSPSSRPSHPSPAPSPWPRTHLPLWPNRRKRTQKMMQVTPMWMPMTMPVADVWSVASSFRQSHGGLRAAGRGRGRLETVAVLT